MRCNLKQAGFQNNREDGFKVRFENGYTLSVQWTEWNYCERQYAKGVTECEDAEIAVIDEHGEFVTDQFLNNGDDVQGWQKPEQVAELMAKVAKAK